MLKPPLWVQTRTRVCSGSLAAVTRPAKLVLS